MPYIQLPYPPPLVPSASLPSLPPLPPFNPLGLVQTSNFTCAKSNANKHYLICIRFGTCEIRRLKQALYIYISVTTGSLT